MGMQNLFCYRSIPIGFPPHESIGRHWVKVHMLLTLMTRECWIT